MRSAKLQNVSNSGSEQWNWAVEGFRELGALARSMGGLTLIGASVGLGIGQIASTALPRFTTENWASVPDRQVLLWDLGVGAAVGLLCAGLIFFRRGATLDRLTRTARLLAPLALAGLVPGLLGLNGWSDTLVVCLLLTGFVVGILLAPASGKETRKKIQDEVGKTGEKAKDGFEKIAKEAEKGIRVVREKT